MKKTFIILTAALFCFCACDVFTPEKLLEKTPQSKISPADFFSNETELQLYTNPLYDLFDNSLMYKRSSTDRFSDHFRHPFRRRDQLVLGKPPEDQLPPGQLAQLLRRKSTSPL